MKDLHIIDQVIPILIHHFMHDQVGKFAFTRNYEIVPNSLLIAEIRGRFSHEIVKDLLLILHLSQHFKCLHAARTFKFFTRYNAYAKSCNVFQHGSVMHQLAFLRFVFPAKVPSIPTLQMVAD